MDQIRTCWIEHPRVLFPNRGQKVKVIKLYRSNKVNSHFEYFLFNLAGAEGRNFGKITSGTHVWLV